jgi:N-acetylglucosamine kinase-like BadF-type ATPase
LTAVLGVDGGQSAIRLRHSASPRIVEVEGVSRQEGDTVSNVAEQVARGWREGTFAAVDRVVLGLTTAPVEAAAADRLCGLVAATTGASDVWLTDDAITAHAGALSMGWGISVVAGTGVAALARPPRGEPRVIGGHGFLLGDEGGAFWIGRRGLAAVLRAGEGRGAPTSLTDAARGRFGRLDDLHVRLHELDRPVDAIARFAPDVLDQATSGDSVAGSIVAEAADELVLVARAASTWLGATDGDAPLALGGRLLEPGTELRRQVEARLVRAALPVVARSADGPPLVGAIELGLAGDPLAYHGLIHTWSGGAAA